MRTAQPETGSRDPAGFLRRPFPIPFPIKGVSKADARGRQPDGTCPDALNVRGVSPRTRRRGGGSREGTIKAFINAAGQADAGPVGKRITGAVRCVRSWNEQINPAGNNVNVTDEFSNYALPNNFNGFFSGTDFRGEYVVFSKNPSQAYATMNPSTGIYPNGPFFPTQSTDPRAAFKECRVDALPISGSANYGLAINYATSNRVRLTLRINPTPFGNRGASFPSLTPGQCTNLAVFVRGSANLGNFVCGYLVATSTNVVQLRVETHVAGTVTTYTSSQTHNLSGVASLFASTLSLELIATAGAIIFRAVWSDENIDETYTLSQNPPGLTLASNNRAGVIYRHSGSSAYRSIAKIEYTKITPLIPEVLYSIFASDADRNQGRWQIPRGWDSVYITDSTIEGYRGDSSAYSENGSTPTVNYPTIDRVGVSPASGAPAEAQIYGGQTNGTTGEGGANAGGSMVNHSRIMLPSDYYTDAAIGALTETPDIELAWNDNDGTIDDSIGGGFRIDGIEGTYP
jgi:hypothetical protein